MDAHKPWISSFLRFLKIQSFVFRLDFSKGFTGIIPYKTRTKFFATLQYFLEIINPINKCKQNIFHLDVIVNI